MEDLLRKWYKTSFKKLKVLTPYKAWREIEVKLKDWPRHWYQSNVEAISAEVDENIWNGMNAQLNVINNQIKHRRQQPFRLAIYTLFLLCLPFTFNNSGYELLMNGSGNTPLASFESTTSNQSKESKSEPLLTNVVKETNNNSRNYLALNVINDAPFDKDVKYIQTAFATGDKARKESNETEIVNHLMDLNVLDLKIPIIENNVGFHSIVNDGRKHDTQSSKWGVGVSGKVYNGGLINPVSLMARDNSNVDQQRAIEFSYGIRVSRRLSSRSAIQLDFSMNDNRSHIYARKDNNNGLSETKLNFASIGISSVNSLRIASEKSKRKQSIDLATGIFLSHRYAASERQNNVEVDFLKSGYKRYNFGVNTGLEYSIELNNHFKWSTGLSYRAGLINLFDGVKKVPSDFYKTHSYSFGVSSTIVYLF